MTKKKVFFLIILVLVVIWLASVAANSYKPGGRNSITDIGNGVTAPLAVGDGIISKKTMDNGLIIEVLQEGSGPEAKEGNVATVHYTGTFIDGSVFDSSVTRGEPFAFTLGGNRVIAGWEQGVLGMKVGEKRRLTVPYTLGYGEAGYGPIPAKSTLMFDIELLKID